MTKVKKYYDLMNNAYYDTYELEYDLDSIATAMDFINTNSKRNAVRGFDGGVVWYNNNGDRLVCNTGYVIYKTSKDKLDDFHIENKKFFEDMIEVVNDK